MPVANFSRGCKQGCLGKVGGIGRACTKARMRAPAIVEIQVPAKPGARLGDAGIRFVIISPVPRHHRRVPEFRQKFHLSKCSNLANHLSHLVAAVVWWCL
jgi:hypothetical protein